MRLLSCHIESFGKLHDIRIDFNDKLTVIKEDNSSGKTTLADFITSMFYDLPDLKRRGLENDRLRYDPWEGGIYGGSLAFEHMGRSYEIQRDFAKHSFSLTDISTVTKKIVLKINGKAVDRTNLGVVLFEINKESFRKSAYIPQNEIICTGIEPSLNDKLRNLLNATDENHSLEKSVKLLEKAADDIESKRGVNGKLVEINKRISKLCDEIEECKACFDKAELDRKEWEKLEKQRQKYDTEVAECEEKIKAQTRSNILMTQQKHYQSIRERIRNCNEAIAKLSPFFGSQKIEDIDLDKIKEKIDTYKKQQNALKAKEMVAERIKLDSNNHQTTKELIEIQLKGFDNEKQRYDLEREKAIKEITALRKTQQKHQGVLYVILCIITFGLFFAVTKNKNKKIADRVVDLQHKLTDMIDKLKSWIQKYRITSRYLMKLKRTR